MAEINDDEVFELRKEYDKAWALLWETWWKQVDVMNAKDVPQMTKVMAAVLGTGAATLAFDGGMTEKQFLAVCQKTFRQIASNAPKWQ